MLTASKLIPKFLARPVKNQHGRRVYKLLKQKASIKVYPKPMPMCALPQGKEKAMPTGTPTRGKEHAMP